MWGEGGLDGLYRAKVEILEDRVNVVSEQEWVRGWDMVHQTVVYWDVRIETIKNAIRAVSDKAEVVDGIWG